MIRFHKKAVNIASRPLRLPRRPRLTVRNQAFPENRYRFLLIPEISVKRDDCGVRFAYHELDFGNTALGHQLLAMRYKRTPEADALPIRIDRKVVDPPSVSVEARHARRDDPALLFTDKKERRILSQFTIDIFVRIIPRTEQPRLFP